MTERGPRSSAIDRLIVTGDATIDSFEVSVPPVHADARETADVYTWQTSPGIRCFALPGEALLLASLVKQATGLPVLAPDVPDPAGVSPRGLLHAHFSVERVRESSNRRDKTVYRIQQYKGFTGPSQGPSASLLLQNDSPDVKLVVLDDAGNGFREAREGWPAALQGERRPLVLLKMGRPIARGSLWEALRDHHAERLVVVVNADDLRRENGHISRRLSWERTATDFVWQMAYNPQFAALKACAYLIVRFGIEGAILYPSAGRGQPSLFFHPQVGEDGSADLYPGRMRGLGAAFTAAVAAHLMRAGLEDMSTAARAGILAAHRLTQRGYGNEPEHLGYPGPDLFRPRQRDELHLVDVVIPRPRSQETADPDYWCILDDLSPVEIEGVACRFVAQGSDVALNRFPVGIFRGLRTVDRSEIEAYRSLQNLVRQYLSGGTANRPLSIAVFGPPGSGKSFGVTQVVESVESGHLRKLEFNLSQFSSVDQLAAAFHRVRDVSLARQIPLVFFDEFDSDFHGKLGWLKYFLAPMQAGEFRDHDGMHPLGRGIFVFAGGTSSTFAEFAHEANSKAPAADEGVVSAKRQVFRDAKGPDFVSRMRGYIDLKSIDQGGERDHLYPLRRALVLRTQLQEKASHLFGGDGMCHIDRGVLRALLTVPAYKHGVRSISALVEMSMLFGRKRFERASLPAPSQLDLHVDSKTFLRLVMEHMDAEDLSQIDRPKDHDAN